MRRCSKRSRNSSSSSQRNSTRYRNTMTGRGFPAEQQCAVTHVVGVRRPDRLSRVRSATCTSLNIIPTNPPVFKRIFIGIPCDRQAHRHINEVLSPIRKSPLDIRWVPENNRHLTLAFLGDIPISSVEDLVGLLGETYQQQTHFQYKLTRLTRFPEPTGRIIALVNEPDGALDNLFQLSLSLLQRTKLELDRKEFRPHITLGRIRRAKHVKTLLDQPTDICLDVTKVRLYQSTMTRSGSIYTALKEVQLG